MSKMSSKLVLEASLGVIKSVKPILLRDGPTSKLPEAYKKFYREWKFQKPTPVHYIPEPGKWKRNPETGEVSRVENVPIPTRFAPEMENMLLGGERIIKGFVKPNRLSRRVPRWWLPVLKRTVVHSEILGTYMPTLLTERSPACDLQTNLALKLKRKMLQALATGNCHPDDPTKRDYILEKYAKYMVPMEEAEWYGLSLKEAMLKHHLAQQQEIVPLKHQYRAELVQRLQELGPDNIEIETEQKSSSWLSRINPFASKETSRKD
ncbi:hypothetical protein B566_EDAN010136 [Ephemera danica]|nr:hypothetical protein B566_EDAN010136 [Ephemera danica]